MCAAGRTCSVHRKAMWFDSTAPGLRARRMPDGWANPDASTCPQRTTSLDNRSPCIVGRSWFGYPGSIPATSTGMGVAPGWRASSRPRHTPTMHGARFPPGRPRAVTESATSHLTDTPVLSCFAAERSPTRGRAILTIASGNSFRGTALPATMRSLRGLCGTAVPLSITQRPGSYPLPGRPHPRADPCYGRSASPGGSIGEPRTLNDPSRSAGSSHPGERGLTSSMT